MFATSATKIQTVASDGVISSAGRKMDLPVFDKTVKYIKKVVSCMMVPLLLGYKLKMLAITHFNFISESSQ